MSEAFQIPTYLNQRILLEAECVGAIGLLNHFYEPQQNNNVTAYVSTPNILLFELAKKDRTVINHGTRLIEVAADSCLDGCL